MKGIKIMAFAFVIMLVVTAVVMNVGTVVAEEPQQPEITLPSHVPISIVGNSEFTVGNGVSSGTGTSGDPYIIENWDINGTGYGYSIYIDDTTDYFVIRNCNLYDAYVLFGDSIEIRISNSTNGLIINNTISNSQHGIEIFESSNTTVQNNNITEVWNYPIRLTNSYNVSFLNNSIYNCDDYGISLEGQSSNNNTVRENRIINSNFGIYNDQSIDNTTIIDNYIYNSIVGIWIDDLSNYCAIENNTIDISVEQSIAIYNGDNCTIIGNRMSNSSGHGLWLDRAKNNTIYHNNFLDNVVHAFDNDGNNSWNGTYEQGGNFWDNYTGVDNFQGENQDIAGSDEIGDTPYYWIENNLTQDNYPLIEYYEVPVEEFAEEPDTEEEQTAYQVLFGILVALFPFILLFLLILLIIKWLVSMINDDGDKKIGG